MYFIYSLIYLAAIVILFPFEYFKRPAEIRKRWIREKLGVFGSSLTRGASSSIWVHAVSVGEVMAASPLLKRLKERFPERDIVLSTVTDTGRKVAGERAPEGTEVVYLPFDLPVVLKRVLCRVRPSLLIVIETELWPNLIRSFKEMGIPVLLLNGRISEKSFSGYRKISFFMKRVLSYVDYFGMQGEEYANRIRLLGAESKKVGALGNFKFDIQPPADIPEWTRRLSGPVVTAGSTHDGEEELLARVFLELKKDIPDLNLILAPRHPERFGPVADMLGARGIAFVRRSALDVSGPSSVGTGKLKGTIILLDTVGELSSVYGASDVAVIGKSFRGLGGQNPLEPAYWGKPILCGPHMENFPFIEEFYREGAAIEVSEEDLREKIEELIQDAEKARKSGSKAKLLYGKNAGAVGRALEIIEKYL